MVSSLDTLIGESCFTQLLSVLRFTPYSRSSYGYEVPPAYRTKLISKEILQKKLEELTELLEKNQAILPSRSSN